MNQKTSFELLLVRDKIDYWEVEGITYSNAMRIEPGCQTLRATLFAIEACKKALAEGAVITIGKKLQYAEVQPGDLVIGHASEIETARRRAINEISARMHQALFAISILDLMDYLNDYMKLLNAGCFITDENREDKYFEIIEAAQENEEPADIPNDSSFEQQQEYIEKKQKYNLAQENLKTLESYLNNYDKLSQYKTIVDFMMDTRKKINDAQSIEDINYIMTVYKTNLENYKIVNA